MFRSANTTRVVRAQSGKKQVPSRIGKVFPLLRQFCYFDNFPNFEMLSKPAVVSQDACFLKAVRALPSALREALVEAELADAGLLQVCISTA